MWNKLTDLLLKIYDLVRTTDRQTRQIVELEKQFNDLQRSFERFALAYQKDREREETERKLLLSRIETFYYSRSLKRRKSARSYRQPHFLNQNQLSMKNRSLPTCGKNWKMKITVSRVPRQNRVNNEP